MTTPMLTSAETRHTKRFAKPMHHMARLAEKRTEDEQDTLLAIDEIVIEDPKLCLYYRNRLAHAGLEA